MRRRSKFLTLVKNPAIIEVQGKNPAVLGLQRKQRLPL